MRGLYNYCMLICIAVLTNFHSVPTFPKCESGAFNGDYSGVQGLSLRTCARKLPSAGFAILSAFQNLNPFRKRFNHLTPNDHYMGRPAQLTSRCCILYIYLTNIHTEYFKHAA